MPVNDRNITVLSSTNNAFFLSPHILLPDQKKMSHIAGDIVTRSVSEGLRIQRVRRGIPRSRSGLQGTYTSKRSILCICIGWLVLMGCSNTRQPTVLPKLEKGSSGNSTSAESTIKFGDVTQSLGLKHIYRNGEEANAYTYLEAMGGGLASLDYDRDGAMDLFLTGGGSISEQNTISGLPGALWRNQAGQTMVDVTSSSQVGDVGVYTQGTAVADYNNDGFPDLLVTGYGGLQFFVNQGDGTFIEAANEIGLRDEQWSTSAGFGDFNNDGSVDLYVAHYVDWSWQNNPNCTSTAGVREICPPAAFKGVLDSMFINQEDGSFRSATEEWGLVPEGRGLGVACAHFDDDQHLDVYVANDAVNNFMYFNQNGERFIEQGVSSGTALDERGMANGSMGVAVLDFDADLLPDLWVSNYENETFALYKNEGGGNFRVVTASTGLTTLGTLFVAFGTIAADLDSDGYEDVVVANGHVLRSPPSNSVPQYQLLVRNIAGKRFVRPNYENSGYFSKKLRGRGVIHLDFDGDGDMDLAFINVNQPAALLENRTVPIGHWLQIELVGTHGNRDAIGARLVVQTDQRRILRQVSGGGSYLSQAPYTVHFGLPPGQRQVDIEITWPGGGTQKVPGLEVNRKHRVVQSEPAA